MQIQFKVQYEIEAYLELSQTIETEPFVNS